MKTFELAIFDPMKQPFGSILFLAWCFVLTSCGEQGCTDLEASNFSATADYDDGTCIYCTCSDPRALNFDPRYRCSDREECNYASDDLVGKYVGTGVVTYESIVNDTETIAMMRFEVGQEDWNPNILWVEENYERYEGDTACVTPFANPSDTLYNVTFVLNNDFEVSCYDRLPLNFDFERVGDSLFFEGDYFVNPGEVIRRKLFFRGERYD